MVLFAQYLSHLNNNNGKKFKVQMLNRDFCFLEFSKLITPQGFDTDINESTA